MPIGQYACTASKKNSGFLVFLFKRNLKYYKFCYYSYDKLVTELGVVQFIIGIHNRTEWSPIRSVIIRVINKIGQPRSGSPICLITSMFTDRIGRHEVLLPINHITITKFVMF